MSSFLSRFSFPRRSAPIALSDQEKGAAYERDRTRLSKIPRPGLGPMPPAPAGSRSSQHQRYARSFAPNPAFVKFLRFLLYGLTSIAALATAGVGLAVVQYYNSHGPVIKPSWGSLIAVIIFGIGTPGVLFGLFLITPLLFRPGSVGGLLNQVRIELFMLFNMSVIWISGALALACDLRGREFCLWDGYWHYPKPSDFDNVCELINVTVALAYVTFGLAALQMSVVFAVVIYILLYLDQEVLTEPTNDMGGRAYRARVAALAHFRTRRDAHRSGVSTAGPLSPSPMSDAGPMAGGTPIPASRRVPEGAATDNESGSPGPMMSGSPGPMMTAGSSFRDMEDGGRRQGLADDSEYYGFDNAARNYAV